MKLKKKLLGILPVAAALMLASCASPIAKRIEHNPQIFNSLPETHKRLAATGQIIEGMSKEGVFIAWGHPNRKSGGSSNGKKIERWSYAGYDAVHGTALGVGYGHGHWGHPYCYDFGVGYYYQPTVTYIPYERRWVEFTNNRVSAWSVTP